MHLIERCGSRAGTRSTTTPGRSAGSYGGVTLTDPLGRVMGPSGLSAFLGVVDGCALAETDVDGFVGEGESEVVRGVKWLFEFLTGGTVFWRVELLKTDELELVCELADPTVLRVSPMGDSASSGGGRAVSGTEPFGRDRDVKPGPAPSSDRVLSAAAEHEGVRRPLASTACADGDSCALILALSRSIALSLASLGAAGKNWAKVLAFAPGGRGGIAKMGDVYRSRRPPTIISCSDDAENHHA
ncbi:hypothetical protein B0T22DRAFT_211141 [Podospora appendiculata]|uniref:Uncharacterized protein n=1 Tax=Podospora appendiculata TaxID=314037 RepID=A0AAE1CA30_9PEZI|nr:hypothetical protein B0T22DRAFT_211141 [Podospora appendiculata]